MFTLYHADCIGQAGNCLYPHKVEITDTDSLERAVSRDYVCAEYEGFYRSNDNFIGSNCLSVECDNDHSDNPADWKTPDDIADAFPGVEFAVHYSRNHMKVKNSRAARPKFHAFFAIDPVTDAEEYASLKRLLSAIFPYFDTKALDAARFYFGTADAKVEIFDGFMTLTEFLTSDEFDVGMNQPSHGAPQVITEGSRNATMSRFAGRVIKKYGDNDTAFQCFMEEAEKCTPPLEEQELMTIWHSAQKFYGRVQQQEGYIPPEQYNQGYSLRPADFSDIGQAKVLAKEYAGEMVYTDATDYMRYDGTHWAESKQLAVGCCEEFLDRQLAEAILAVDKAKQALMEAGIGQDIISSGGKALEKAIDDRSEKAFAEYRFAISYKAFVMKRRDMKYVTSALQAAKPMLLRSIQDFDTQEYLLNTPTATYDLRLGMSGAHDHSPEDLITKMTTVAPSDEGMELWMSSVESFFCGDKELMDYVQQTVGLAAIGKVYQEALIIAYGEGSNGKSTFWNAIAKVLGSYSGSMSADALTVGCKRNVKPEMAELKGKRLVIAAELEEGMRLNTSIVKQMLTILASYAQEESLSASENQKWRIKKNFEEGMPWNGRMLGYRMRNGQYYIIPEEAKIVRRIYREYLDGSGPNRIAAGLNEDGVPTAMNGSIWHPQTIAKMLRNYSYTGNLLLQTTFCENHITKRMLKNTGQRPRYLAEETHEAIIPMEQWQAVQAEIERRSKLHTITPPAKPSFYYTGLIQCAKCGKNYRRKTTATRVVWICATFNTRGKKYCASKQIPESTLDALAAEVAKKPSDIQKIIADDGNTLHFHMADGSVVTRIWADRSRAESWTAEKRETARQQAYERRQTGWQEQSQ